MQNSVHRFRTAFLMLAALGATAQAAGTYEFRAPKKGLNVSTSAPAPSPAPAPAPTYTASLSSTELAFDATLVGQSSTKQVLLSNTGTGALTLGAPQTSGAGFSAATACSATLAAGASCLTDVTFSPTVTGAASGSLQFSTNAQGAPLVVTLSATGVQPQGSLTAVSSSSFGALALGGSTSRQFTFSNTGTAPASGVSASLSGDSGLTFSSNSCGTSGSPVTLASGQSCSMTVAWSPSTTGELSGVLSVASSAPDSPHTLTLSATASDAYTAALVRFDGTNGSTTLVEQVSGKALTNTAVTTSTADVKFGTAAGYLNGSAYAVTQDAYTLGTQDFTIEAWVKPTRTTIQHEDLLGSLASNNNSTWRLISSTSGVLCFAAWNSPPWVMCSTTTVPRNTWSHVAVARSGGSMRLYMNGVQVASTTASATFVSRQIAFGQAGPTYTDGRLIGYIDDFRLSLGVARYTGATYTVPSAPHANP